MKPILTLLFLLSASILSATGPVIYKGEKGPGLGKNLVFIASDHRYRSQETQPMLARILAKHYGFTCTVVFGVNKDGITDPSDNRKPGNNFVPGIEALDKADGMIIFTRFQNWTDEQMAHFVKYLDRAGPVVGLRTSTHGFRIPEDRKYAKYSDRYKGNDYTYGFGRQVLGDRFSGHYEGEGLSSTRIILKEDQLKHPILTGVKDAWATCGGYGARPMEPHTLLAEAQPLLGKEIDAPVDTERPPVPGVWIRHYQGKDGSSGRVFTNLYGASHDFENPGFRRLVINGILWSVGLEDHIKADNNIDIVGPFNPSSCKPLVKVKGKRWFKPEEVAGWDTAIPPLVEAK